jgi:hypothetical protein
MIINEKVNHVMSIHHSCMSMIAWEAHIYIYAQILHHILHKIIKQINDNSLKWISNIYGLTTCHLASPILYHEIWSADMHGE